MKNTSIKLRKFLAIALFLLCGLGGEKAFATHFGAADLYYDYIGPAQAGTYKYRFTATIYRTCEAVFQSALPTSVSMCYGSNNLGFSSTKTLPQISADTLDQLCPNFSSNNLCYNYQGGGLPGFERRIYQDTLTLPGAATDWKFAFTENARNAGITNLSNPGGLSIYIEAGLNNVARYYNSSPRYLVAPVPYLCVNQPSVFQNGPFDPNGDSMVSFVHDPWNNSTCFGSYQTSPYSTGYQTCNPIVYNGTCAQYVFNSATCSASFTPNTIGRFVLAFITEDWNQYATVNNVITPVRMGYISRDVQVLVLNCNAAPPTIDITPTNISGLVPVPNQLNSYTVCPGTHTSFKVHGSSNSISSSVYLELLNQQIVAPLSTFPITNQGGATPVGTFNWTPSGADIGSHVLIFVAKDSTCNNGQPIVLKSYLVVYINVLPGIDAGPDGHYCPPNGLPWQINATGPPGTTYYWSVISGTPFTSPGSFSCTTCPNPKASPLQTTTYSVTAVNVNNIPLCRNPDTIVVFVHPSTPVSAGPSHTICANQSVQLQPSVGQITPAPIVYWTDSTTLTGAGTLNATAAPQVSTYYTIHVTDQNNCHYADSTQVIVNGVAPIVNSFVSRDTVCPEGSSQLFANIASYPCGPSQNACTGTTSFSYVGTSSNSSTTSAPYYYYTYTGGDRVHCSIVRKTFSPAALQAAS